MNFYNKNFLFFSLFFSFLTAELFATEFPVAEKVVPTGSGAENFVEGIVVQVVAPTTTQEKRKAGSQSEDLLPAESSPAKRKFRKCYRTGAWTRETIAHLLRHFRAIESCRKANLPWSYLEATGVPKVLVGLLRRYGWQKIQKDYYYYSKKKQEQPPSQPSHKPTRKEQGSGEELEAQGSGEELEAQGSQREEGGHEEAVLWSEKEDQLLCRALVRLLKKKALNNPDDNSLTNAFLGKTKLSIKDWQEIASKANLDKTAAQCQARWEFLLREENKEQFIKLII